MTKTIDDIIWEIYEEGIKAAFNGSNKYIGTVRSEAKASLLELIKEAEPKKYQKEDFKGSEPDRRKKAYNRAISQYTYNLNQLFKKEGEE